MKIQDIPQQDRPRERLLRLGAAALSDAELLAVLLGSGCRGKSALDLGSELLSQFGSIRGIISQPQPILCQLPGINAASYALIQACHELISRLLREKLSDQGGLYNADDVEAFLVARMSHLPHEVFACIFLNNSNKILKVP